MSEQKHKIIATDNFNRESVADWLVADNISNEAFAETMAEALNEKYGGQFASDYYMVVPQEQKLWRGMEELI